MTEEMTAPTIEQTPTTEEQEDLPENFFSDEESTEIKDEEEKPTLESEESKEEVKEESKEETKEETLETKPFLTIKHNKKARDLSQEEAIELAQKGANYDHIYEQYSSLKQFEGIQKELNDLAKSNGMTLEDYINNLKEVQSQFELNKEVEELKKTYGEVDDSLINELANYRIGNRHSIAKESAEKKKESEENSLRQEVEKQVDRFSAKYPDLEPDKLDKQVYELMNEGYTLLEAYETVKNEKQAIEDRIKEKQELSNKQNEENKKKSLGNLNNTGSIEKDDFLSGFMSD